MFRIISKGRLRKLSVHQRNRICIICGLSRCSGCSDRCGWSLLYSKWQVGGKIYSTTNYIKNRYGQKLSAYATALLAHCDMSGNYNDEFAVIECDEGDFAKISYQFKSSNITVVVTNLFRDQLDRYGEIDRTKEYILSAVLCMPQAVLCLNADCSLTSSIGKDI